MRITQSMLANNSLRHLSNNYDRLGKLQEQLHTGKKITRPSDDPVSAMKGLTYRTNVAQVEQFKRNFTEAHNWIDNTDAALDQAINAMHRINDLTVRAANETLDEDQREAIATEINELRKQLVNISETKVGDKYIFNGTDTKSPPNIVDNEIKPNVSSVEIELGKGITIPVNVTGVFTEELFQAIDGVIDDIRKNGDIQAHISKVDEQINHLLNKRTSLGAKANRIELMEQRIDQQEIIAKKMMSENEDADYEKVITDLIIEESILRASLSASARIVQPTLLDFLR